MYESCQEAHRHWLEYEKYKAKIDLWDSPGFEPAKRAADQEYISAATSWKAHKLGVCSCVAKRLVERSRSRDAGQV
jgi:predicted GTPase